MQRLVLILGWLLLTTGVATSEGNSPPPVPEGGLIYTHQSVCTDIETQEEGYCYLAHDLTGIVYLTFWQDGEMKFIRQVTADGYITLWQLAAGEML